MLSELFHSATGTRRKLMIATFLTFVLIALCIVILIFAVILSPRSEGDTQKGNVKLDYTDLPISSDDIFAKGTLRLVNTQYPIQIYPSDGELLTIQGVNKHSSYTLSTNQHRLAEVALTAFNRMLDDYAAQTGDTNTIITAAYRTAKEQESFSAPVGTSDHHLALSVAVKNYSNSSPSYLPADHWIYQNCAKYGFIQRYPAGKEEYTGTKDYIYCLRYVGVPHATYMKENNLCLEEYIALLKSYPYSGDHLKVSAGGSDYEIYYVKANLASPEERTAEDSTASTDTTASSDSESGTAITTIPVPSGYDYEISGNNADGFIVTVKLR